MTKNDELRYGPPGETAVHLCVDMQRMFAERTEWKMPWLERVLPNILSITSTHPERTIFTRFIPAQRCGQGVGMWRHYYERWGSMTIDQLGPEMIGLVPDLATFVPPARTCGAARPATRPRTPPPPAGTRPAGPGGTAARPRTAREDRSCVYSSHKKLPARMPGVNDITRRVACSRP